MPTIVTHSARWTPVLRNADVEAPFELPAGAPLPPREAWPLLATVVATWLLMLATIAWYATGA